MNFGESFRILIFNWLKRLILVDTDMEVVDTEKAAAAAIGAQVASKEDRVVVSVDQEDLAVERQMPLRMLNHPISVIFIIYIIYVYTYINITPSKAIFNVNFEDWLICYNFSK